MARSQPVKVSTCHDIDIFCTGDGQFTATFDGEEVCGWKMSEVVERIEKYMGRQKKAARKKYAIKCVDDQLNETTVTGIHARFGSLLMKPELEETKFGGAPDVFLDSPRTRAIIESLIAARERVAAIEAELANAKIEVGDGYRYGALSDRDFQGLLEQLDERVASATEFVNAKS